MIVLKRDLLRIKGGNLPFSGAKTLVALVLSVATFETVGSGGVDTLHAGTPGGAVPLPFVEDWAGSCQTQEGESTDLREFHFAFELCF